MALYFDSETHGLIDFHQVPHIDFNIESVYSSSEIEKWVKSYVYLKDQKHGNRHIRLRTFKENMPEATVIYPPAQNAAYTYIDNITTALFTQSKQADHKVKTYSGSFNMQILEPEVIPSTLSIEKLEREGVAYPTKVAYEENFHMDDFPYKNLSTYKLRFKKFVLNTTYTTLSDYEIEHLDHLVYPIANILEKSVEPKMDTLEWVEKQRGPNNTIYTSSDCPFYYKLWTQKATGVYFMKRVILTLYITELNINY